MRETNFIQQNKDKWKDFEEELSSEVKDPDKLSNILIQITDDLSYSRTFYPNRSVRVYLNIIAQQIFQSIYKNKKEKKQKFVSFWKDELPLVVYKCRVQLLISLLVFIISVAIGVLSSIYDKEFSRLILGDSYVEMTLENIKKGDPMGVYKDSGQMPMFLHISLNNVRVALITFLSGVFFAVGSVLIMMFNGIMVGTFQYFFYERGLFLDSFLTIWLHGTLEISSIIIAGGSGLVLGRGLVFPGTYSRVQAFQISAKQGLKLFVGVVPIIVFAALIEGFVTRYTGVPDFVKAILIFTSLAFVCYYFIYCPYVKSKGATHLNVSEPRLQPTKIHKIDTTVIKNNSEIFKDIFTFYRNNFKRISTASLVISLAYTGISFIVIGEKLYKENYLIQFYDRIAWFFDYSIHVPVFVMNTLFLGFLAHCVFQAFYNKEMKVQQRLFLWQAYKPITVFAFFNLIFFLPAGLSIPLCLLLIPVVLLWVSVSYIEELNIFVAFGRMLQVMQGVVGKLAGLYGVLLLMTLIFLMLLLSPIIYIFTEAIEISVLMSREVYNVFYSATFLFIIVFATGLILPILFTGKTILFFSLREINEANHLREMISRLLIPDKRNV